MPADASPVRARRHALRGHADVESRSARAACAPPPGGGDPGRGCSPPRAGSPGEGSGDPREDDVWSPAGPDRPGGGRSDPPAYGADAGRVRAARLQSTRPPAWSWSRRTWGAACPTPAACRSWGHRQQVTPPGRAFRRRPFQGGTRSRPGSLADRRNVGPSWAAPWRGGAARRRPGDGQGRGLPPSGHPKRLFPSVERAMRGVHRAPISCRLLVTRVT